MSERILKSSGRTWLAVRWACLLLIILAIPLKHLGANSKADESVERPPSFQDLITSTTMLKPQPMAAPEAPRNGAHTLTR